MNAEVSTDSDGNVVVTEEDLSALLAGIQGHGELNWLHVPGMTTYLRDDVPAERWKHEGCLELERRGLIRRVADYSNAPDPEDKRVVWEAVPAAGD